MYFVKTYLRTNMFVRSFVESCPGQVLNNIDFRKEKKNTAADQNLLEVSVARIGKLRMLTTFPVQSRSWTVFSSSDIPAV